MRFLVIALLLIGVLGCGEGKSVTTPDAATESCFVFDDAGIGRPRCVRGFERDD